MSKIFILAVIVTMAGCATNVVDENYLKGVDDVVDVDVLLSQDTRNFSEKLYLRGVVTCDDAVFTKLRGKKTAEDKAILVATRPAFNKDTYIKAKLPANKPIGLRYLKNKVTDQHFIDFVVMLEANKSYQISNLNKIEVIEKDSKKSALFLPHDFLHQQLKCK